MDAAKTQEATILEQSEEIRKWLFELQDILASRFNRHPTEACGEDIRNEESNVLDEIAENLSRAESQIAGIIDVIQFSVLPKIS